MVFKHLCQSEVTKLSNTLGPDFSPGAKQNLLAFAEVLAEAVKPQEQRIPPPSPPAPVVTKKQPNG